jgi:hypothetical protein
MAYDAFFPISNTFALDVTTSSQALSPTISPVPLAPDIQNGGFEYRFANVGTQTVWLAQADPAAANPTATVVATGNNLPSMPILANTVATMKFVYGTKLAVIAPAVGSTIYVTIGRGINV